MAIWSSLQSGIRLITPSPANAMAQSPQHASTPKTSFPLNTAMFRPGLKFPRIWACGRLSGCWARILTQQAGLIAARLILWKQAPCSSMTELRCALSIGGMMYLQATIPIVGRSSAAKLYLMTITSMKWNGTKCGLSVKSMASPISIKS